MNSPYHTEFLKDYPSLQEWLSLNGFSMIYSIMSLEMNAVFSMWSDRCKTEGMTHTAAEAENCLFIVYCRKCKTVEVYNRGFLGEKGTDDDISAIMKPYVKNTIGEKIESVLGNMVDSCEDFCWD